jgi:hypothetical protein
MLNRSLLELGATISLSLVAAVGVVTPIARAFGMSSVERLAFGILSGVLSAFLARWWVRSL